MAILPTYVSLVFVGAQSLLVIRAVRLLRVFRVLKLAHFLGEAQYLTLALRPLCGRFWCSCRRS